ncbi:MAG: hypothetical protein ACREC6_07435 [Hyphomicrobiaceae bacterium]
MRLQATASGKAGDNRRRSADTLSAGPARGRWPSEKIAAFRRLAPAAVYIAGTEGPVPRRFGDNRGAWPIRIGVTASWKDIITPQLEHSAPLWWQGVLFRVWTPDEVHAKRLALEIPEFVAARVEQLRGAWLDLGVETDLALFEVEVHHLAERLKIKTWDDDALSRTLDGWLAAQAEKRAKGA